MSLYNIVVVLHIVAMRLIDWRQKADKNQADVAIAIGVTTSQLSKIERGETFVSPKTGDLIRTLTEGAVTLDDLHDQWREYQAAKTDGAAA